MSTQYPNNIDSYVIHADNNNETITASTVNNLQDAIVAIENMLGKSGLTVLPSPVPSAGTKAVVNHQWYESDGTQWVLMFPTASSSILGGVKVGSGVNVATDGTISVNTYSLPVSTSTVLGGVKVGSGVSVAGDGTISYTLPISTSSVLGGVKIGSGINVSSGTISTDTTTLGAIPTSQKGISNGVASLDGSGKVPSTQLPSASTNTKSATLVVAASNSSANGKAGADYVCDGVDDQTEINSALTALGVVGGKVVLLEGTFNITGSINTPSNCSLEGQGNGTALTIPNANNTTFNVIQNTDQTNGNSGISISNLKIDGNKANNTAGTQNGIYLAKVSYSILQNVAVVNMRTNGVYLNGTSNYNAITGNTCQGNGYGVYLNGTSNYTIVTGNTCQGNSTGIALVGTSNYNEIIGNTCQGNGTGINISSPYNTVTGNACQGNTFQGILLATTNNIVTGNTCQGNGTHGIYFSSASHNTVSGNTCLENSQTTNNTSDNIYIYGTSNTNNIQGNTCRQGALTNKPRYGIRIDTSTCSGNLVTNNDLTTGGATGAFSDVGTGTITTAGNKTA